MDVFVENRFETIKYCEDEKVELPVAGAAVYIEFNGRQHKLDNLLMYKKESLEMRLSGRFNRYSIENYIAKNKNKYPEGLFKLDAVQYLLDFIDPNSVKLRGDNSDASKLLELILQRIEKTGKEVLNDYIFEFVAQNLESKERLVINTSIVDASKSYKQKVNLADKNLELTVKVFNNRKVLTYPTIEGLDGIKSIFPAMTEMIELVKKFYAPKFLLELIYNSSPIPEIKTK